MRYFANLFKRSPRRTLTRAATRHRAELFRLDAMETELKRYRASIERQLQAVERDLFALETGNPSRVTYGVDLGCQRGDRTGRVTLFYDEAGRAHVVKLESDDDNQPTP